jgi:hypothetical protein
MKGVLETNKQNFGSNRNKPKQDLFWLCFGLFGETKNKKFRFVLVCFSVSNLPKQTELFRKKPKQTETALNFQKNTQICSLSNCLGWFAVCWFNQNIETLCFGIEAKQPKQTEKN